MNPYTHLLNRYFTDTNSIGEGNSAALYTVLKILEAAYTSGYVAGSNPYRYVRDAIVAYSGRNPFGVWVAQHLNADIDAFDAGRIH